MVRGLLGPLPSLRPITLTFVYYPVPRNLHPGRRLRDQDLLSQPDGPPSHAAVSVADRLGGILDERLGGHRRVPHHRHAATAARARDRAWAGP